MLCERSISISTLTLWPIIEHVSLRAWGVDVGVLVRACGDSWKCIGKVLRSSLGGLSGGSLGESSGGCGNHGC